MPVGKKISILFFGMSACFVFLAGALTRLQIFQADMYRELALNNRIRRVAVSAPRGMIFDRNNKVIASSRPSYDVELVLDEVGDLDRMAKDLSEILNIKAEEIVRKVKSGRYLPYLPVIVARDVGMEKLTRLLETRKDLSGINVAVRSVRHYPHGSAAAHVLGTLGQISPGEYQRWKKYGYSPQDIIGKTGIELAFNAQLVGQAGGMQVQVDSRGNKDKVLGYKAPVKGRDVVLTLDLELQKVAERQMEGKRGAIVALDARSAEVLAMVSSPAFTPEIFVESAKRKERQAILGDRTRPLVNRAISGRYPAGSVLKILVGLAGLESKAIRPDTRYYCPGEFRLGERSFHCWRKHGHGTLDLCEALKYSCNVYFYRAGLETGNVRIQTMARAFGLGECTALALPNESAGLVPSPEWKKKNGLGAWTKGDTANLSIGQGYLLVTPVQMAALAVALGNGGIWRAPLVVRRISQPGRGQTGDPPLAPFAREISVAKESLWKIQEGMVRVVNEKDATGYSAHMENIVAAGKTGTVQTSSDRTSKKDHAWFVGYAPAKDPRIALSVIVENAGTGGTAAAPVAKEMFNAYFSEKEKDIL